MGFHKQVFQDSFTRFEPLFVGDGFCSGYYPRGTLVGEPGSLGDTIYYVKEGGIRVNIINEDGKEANITRAPNGCIFPLNCFDIKRNPLPVDMVLRAGQNTKTIEFQPQTLERLFRSNGDFALQCFEHKCKEENLYLYRITGMTVWDSQRRVCEVLMDLSRVDQTEDGSEIDIMRMPQDELAAGLGLSRIQFSRVLQSLREDGVIDTQRKKIVILDAEKLREMCR